MKFLSLSTLKLWLTALILVTPLSSLSDNKTIRLSEPVEKSTHHETFGRALDDSINKVALEAVLEAPNKYMGMPLLIETQIVKVCQKKGCFFIAQAQNKVMRISFKDYAFFIPTDSASKHVIMTGKVVEKQLSAAQAEHFSQDLDSQVNAIKAGKVFEFIADSIRIFNR